jgi:hypothetical protein
VRSEGVRASVDTVRPRPWVRATTVMALGVVLGLLVPLPAGASEPTGSCTRGSRWRLSLVKDTAQITVTFRLLTEHPRRLWRIRLFDDGEAVFRIERRTNALGDVRVVRSIPNRPGTDELVIRARNLQGIETCRIEATI